jgi:hypothetical protein
MEEKELVWPDPSLRSCSSAPNRAISLSWQEAQRLFEDVAPRLFCDAKSDDFQVQIGEVDGTGKPWGPCLITAKLGSKLIVMKSGLRTCMLESDLGVSKYLLVSHGIISIQPSLAQCSTILLHYERTKYVLTDIGMSSMD